MMRNYTEITADNLDAEKSKGDALDQRAEFVVGCETWQMNVPPSGRMSRYPNGRGAVETGGDSYWGDWTTLADAPVAWLKGQRVLVLDDGQHWVTEEGEFVDPVTGEAPESVS